MIRPVMLPHEPDDQESHLRAQWNAHAMKTWTTLQINIFYLLQGSGQKFEGEGFQSVQLIPQDDICNLLSAKSTDSKMLRYFYAILLTHYII